MYRLFLQLPRHIEQVCRELLLFVAFVREERLGFCERRVARRGLGRKQRVAGC